MKRREFLKIAAGASLSVPSLFGCTPEITPTDQSTGLSLWSLSGDVTDTSALVWLRADAGSEAAVQYATDYYMTMDYKLTKPVAVGPEFSMTAPTPNPSQGDVAIEFSVSRSAQLSVIVYDVAGRQLRRLADRREFSPGNHRLIWDGRLDSGAMARGGIYFVSVRDGAEGMARKTVRVE